ncbi:MULTISPECIES: hypothetical protein [Pseudomonas]|uniref:Ig-like domain-containing protein n=2 Tax=Pseudomonas TaxID=286 RepID=A0ABY7R3P2_9PSED|nr:MULTISPECIES: hypothetical protein [Pseudomonas]KGI95203.1 hypothetical protein MD26_00250 [Pseudomonas sp. H2]MUT52885.1 hypothetical protein [Pseudomonas sp. TDA1]WCH98371.1 hypothetical protein PMC74_16475 [Pseudomonas capeferrum]
MAKLTLTQYLNYLGTETRTMGWGALLIYDRAKTNALLAQEYIERFDKNQYFPPFNDSEETDQNAWSDMQDFILDRPRLSFTNSNIASSRARLSMKVVGGKYVTLVKPIGTRLMDITSIALMDPLNAPSLHMDIRLEESNGGTITDEGRVLLDLSRGESYTFHLSSSEDRNRKLGLALEQEFRSWDDSRKVFELSRIVAGDDDLQPHSFAVRTHSAARAGSASVSQEDDQEEGAVLIGVALKGMSNGMFPINDKDMPYLLPLVGPNEEPYSMNILLSNQQWIAISLGQALQRLEASRAIVLNYPTTPTGKITGVAARTGEIMPVTFCYNLPTEFVWYRGPRAYSLYRYEVLPASIDIGGAIEFKVIDDAIHLMWQSSNTVRHVKFYVEDRNGDVSKTYPATVDTHFSVKYAFVILTEGPDKGKLRLEQVGELEDHFTMAIERATGEFDVLNQFHRGIAAAWHSAMLETFNRFVAVITGAEVTINAMHLNHLLFRSQQAAEPRSVYTPCDLTLLGTLAPDRLHFAISPLEPVIAAGGVQPFSITPSDAQVKWSVDNLPGETGDKGAIGEDDGLYIAPPASSFEGETSRRILITARDGDKFSQALVSITVSDISVYPHLQVAQFGGARYVLVGGDGNGQELDWEMAPGGKGTLRRPDPEGLDSDLDIPEGQDVCIYVSPDRDPSGGKGDVKQALHLDQVVARNVSGNARTIDLLVPWSNPNAWFEVEAHPEGVKLSMWVDAFEGAEEIPPEDAFWYLVKGSGQLNQNIYTPSESSNDYAIIAAVEDYRRLTYAYIVLPLPFIALRKFNALRHAGDSGKDK